MEEKTAKGSSPTDKRKDNAITTPEQEIKSEALAPVSFLQLFRYATKLELVINFIGLVAALASGATQPLMTFLFGRLTNDFINFTQILSATHSGVPSPAGRVSEAAQHFRESASKNATYLVYIGIGMFVFTYLYMCIWVYTGEINAKRIRERYLQAVLRQDIPFFDHIGPGEVATRIQTDTHLVQQGISEKVPIVVSFAGSFFCVFILAFIRSWRLALALSTILPAIITAGALINKFVVMYKQMSLKHVAEGGTIAEEVISTIRTAQAFGTQGILGSLYNGQIAESLKVETKATLANAAGMGIFYFVIYSGYGLAFSFGTTLINEGRATAGDVINVYLAILVGSMSLALLAPEMQAIITGQSAAAKLFETINRVPVIDSANPAGLKPDTVHGKIEFDNVRFCYPSRPTVEVAKGVSITFQAGKTSALVGASGSGKSTIVSLVERFYDPLSGVVKLDGRDIKDLNVKWLRSQIGYVPQEPTLFSTTVKGNVAHGLIGTKYENASEDDKDVLIREACIKANAHSFISELPLGYNTPVGERRILLSGGQKQRVAIARAIVSDPRVLLLDEATSALDTQSEEVVQDALEKASAGHTTITIAHRLSTIKDADIIYVMGQGRVIESGTHAELLHLSGAYARLVESQKLHDTTPDHNDDTLSKKKSIQREIPLSGEAANPNYASDPLEHKRRKEASVEEEENYGIFHLFRRMAPLCRNQWSNYTVGAIFAILTGISYPAYGVVFAKGVDGFSLPTKAERRHASDLNALWFFILAIVSTITITIHNRLFSSAAANVAARLRILSFKSMLRQDISFFDEDKHTTGSLVSQLSDNPQKIEGLAGITLGAIVQTIATVVAGSILGLVFIWKIGLVGIACTPALITVGYIRLQFVVMKDQKNKKAHDASAQMACEAAGAIRTVAALTREDDCLKVYSKGLEGPLQYSNRASILSNLLYAFSQGLSFLVIALVFWYGSILVSRQEASTFQFFIGLMSTVFSAIQSGNMFMFVPDISSAKSAGSDILKLLERQPDIDAESNSGKRLDKKSIKGNIRFENVHFRYPSRPNVRVLRGLSLEVEPGTYIALVGASGSGKSTMIQLIERFYDPLAGSIYLDGQNISELNVQDYRKHLALVSQEPTLYSGTIKFNILLGAVKPHSEVTQAEIENVCRDANILEFIQSLPQGFDTPVGGKGSQLSGGQKQCIAIARALLRNPKVLLLDEATSALDSNSEKVVQVALDHAAKGTTTIAIAHRLSTIQNADRIYFMTDGCVTEAGTHDELLALRGDYYDFVLLQNLTQ